MFRSANDKVGLSTCVYVQSDATGSQLWSYPISDQVQLLEYQPQEKCIETTRSPQDVVEKVIPKLKSNGCGISHDHRTRNRRG